MVKGDREAGMIRGDSGCGLDGQGLVIQMSVMYVR